MSSYLRVSVSLWFVILIAGLAAQPAPGLDLVVSARPALEGLADRVRAIDRAQLAAALERAGLAVPARVEVTLVPEDEAYARAMPRWVVAQAFGRDTIAIFPARVSRYPYDSLESVVWHEVAHLALTAQAGDQPLPRWFHEGVAISVERDWGFESGMRLRLAVASERGLPALERLFDSEAEPDLTRAYLLAATLVADLRQRHGAAVPGAIADAVAGGLPFPVAFAQLVGETPGEAAARAWAPYRRWTNWIPILTSSSMLWMVIVVLALAASFVTVRKRARRRRMWDDDDDDL